MGKSTSTAHVVVTMDGKQAVNLMKQLQQQATITRKELEAMEAEGAKDTVQYKDKADGLKSMTSAINQNKNAYIDLKKIVDNLSGTTLNDLQRALKETKRQMKVLTENDPKFRELSNQYRAIDNQIGRMNGQWQQQDGAIKSVMKRLVAYIGVYGGFNLAIGKMKEMIQLNLKFSDSLADIRKTTGFSAESVNELSDALMKINTRTSVEEIHKLAFEAGKLGLGQYGVGGVEQFVRAADKISVALGEDLGGAEAITQLMKMNDVMGLTQKMGIEKSLYATGSAMNLLSQSTTSTAGYMNDYAKRLSGIARQAHLTMDELIGFAGAADATGQEVEVAATAMNKFIVQLQTHYKTVAQAAGISEEGLHSLLEQGKTAEAATTVLRALGEKGGLSQIAPLMKDMGSDGARLSASLATLASNIDMVDNALMISKKGFSEATSVVSEYNIKNENAAAIMEKMKNSWDKVFTNSGNVGVVKDLTQDLYDMSQELQGNKLIMGELQIIFGLLTYAVKALVAMLPYLTIFLSVKGWIMLSAAIRSKVIPAFMEMIAGMRASGAAMVASTAGVNGAARAWRILNAVMKSNVFVAVASILTTLVVSFLSVKKEIDDVTVSSNNLAAGFKEYTKTAHSAAIESTQLFATLKNAAVGSKAREEAIIAINKNYGKYIGFLITEKTGLGDIEKAQRAVNEQLSKSIALKTQQGAIQDVGEQYTNKMADSTSNIQEVYNKTGVGALANVDIATIIEMTSMLRDKGKSYKKAKELVWNEIYRDQGAIRHNLIKDDMPIGDVKELHRNIDNYIAYYYNQQKAIADIKKKYDPLIGNYQEPETRKVPYTIIEDEKAKAAAAEAAAAKEKRQQVKIAREQYEAVMAAVEVYYKQQQQAIEQAYLDKKITTEQREQELSDIELRHLKTRIEARKKLHGDKDEGWNGEIQSMTSESLSSAPGVQNSLANLMDKDLDAIGEKLRQFGESEDDGIWKKLEEDKLKMQKIAIDHRMMVEKILLEYNFTGKVSQQYQQELEKLKVFFTSYEVGVEGGFKDANSAADAGMRSLADISKQLFTVDINTDEGMTMFKGMIADTEAFGVQMLNMADEDYKTLYYKTVEYGDAITEAEKKTRERQLKIAKERYERGDEFKEQKQTGTQDERMVDLSKNVQSLGLGSDSIVVDQEVLMYQHRLEAAMDYYEYLKTNGYDTEQAQIKVQEAVAELSGKLVEQVKGKMEQLKEYTGSIETFGEEFGAGIFGSLEDRQKALENFVRSTGEATNKLIMQWVKQKIEHAILRRAMVDREEETNDEINDVDKKGDKKAERVEKTLAKAATKRARDFIKDKISIKKDGATEEASVEEESQTVQESIVTQGSGAIGKAMIDIGKTVGSAKKEQAAENVGTQATETAAEVPLGIAGAAAKTLGSLGWWGIPLVAVITALLGGLLSTAMSGVSSLFGGSEAADAGAGASMSTKLKTGMLTYDRGNVQKFSGIDDGKSFPVLGDDGQVYQATHSEQLTTGIVTNPIATMVNGQPSLIAERGPELIVGRETTAAMMMSRPDLLSAIISFDKNRSGFRTYDRGNVQDMAYDSATGEYRPVATDKEAISSAVGEIIAPLLESFMATVDQSNSINRELARQLGNGLHTNINMHGAGGLMEKIAEAVDFSIKNNTNDRIKRLFKKQ